MIERILSSDNFVQVPDFTQSFNRYSYCLNNPLKYTDPSGEFIFASLTSMFFPFIAPLGVILDGACWSAGINAGIQGIRIASGKQDSFNFAGLAGAAAGGAVLSGLSFFAPTDYISPVATGKNGNFSFRDYFSHYSSKASYTSYSAIVSSFVSNGVTNYLSGNQNEIDFYKIGILSYLSSFTNSIVNYFTWDKYSISNRISKLNSEFSGNTFSYNPELEDYGATSLLDGSIELGYNALSSRSNARWTMSHESIHVPDVKELINNNWKNTTESVYNSEIKALVNDMITQSKYGISMRDWLRTTQWFHYGGPYSNSIPKKYLFTFDLLKILRNY